MPEPKDLIGKIGLGDEAAFRRLVDEQGRYLYGIAYAMVGHDSDAQDLVQETFAAAAGGGYRGESSVRTWLVGILVKRAGMLRRSAWRRRVFGMLGRDGSAGGDEAAVPATVAGSDAKIDLATMLADLSPDHRAVIILREVEGMDYEKMARTLGVPRGTIESRLHRAREELRRRYRDYF